MRATTHSIARAITLAAPLVLASVDAGAEQFTSDKVMHAMSSQERFAYVAGVVEGFAISRYLQDSKRPEGMNCIYHWFYDDPKSVDTIYAAFERFPDYPPGSVVEALTRKACA